MRRGCSVAADDGPIRVAGAAESRLERIRQALNVELRTRLARLLADPTGNLQGEKDAIDVARTIRSQVLGIMRKEGLPVVLSVAEAAIADAVDSVVGPRHLSGIVPQGAGVRVSLDADALASIERSVSGVLDEVVTTFGNGADAMRDAIDVGVSTSAPLDKVIDAVAQALDTTFSKAAHAVDTAIMGAGRMALVLQAKRAADAQDEIALFLYDGPIDNKTRDFCREHAGIVYSLRALKALDNGTGFPVVPFLGGPRCRHRLSPIDAADAKAEGCEVTL